MLVDVELEKGNELSYGFSTVFKTGPSLAQRKTTSPVT